MTNAASVFGKLAACSCHAVVICSTESGVVNLSCLAGKRGELHYDYIVVQASGPASG